MLFMHGRTWQLASLTKVKNTSPIGSSTPSISMVDVDDHVVVCCRRFHRRVQVLPLHTTSISSVHTYLYNFSDQSQTVKWIEPAQRFCLADISSSFADIHFRRSSPSRLLGIQPTWRSWTVTGPRTFLGLLHRSPPHPQGTS